MEKIAHLRDDGLEQSLEDHLYKTAELARHHASPWGSEFAYTCGLAHDIGKYSNAFQKRIRGSHQKVDHATASGQLLYQLNPSQIGLYAAYCTMGHHTGMPNGGSLSQDDQGDATLYGRIKRPIEDYSSYADEVTLPLIIPPPIAKMWTDGFDAAFFIRMVFSALVDADWLDTERFFETHNKPRGGYESLSALLEKLTIHTDSLLLSGSSSALNKHRNDLLRNCLAKSTLPPGLFTLSAPTGSGKTKSSLAFALNHAIHHSKRRIIYIVPYNTIIEQNAAVFEELLGTENVLCHYHDMQYDGEDEVSQKKRASIENWDYPIIVTSSVQFFESCFANNPSKCRKLHHISESILIFDEAQMIPLPHLIPCVRVIETLVTQYGCTAVLATATQSAIERYFNNLYPTEILKDLYEFHSHFHRCSIIIMDMPLTDNELTEQIASFKQVLCIVNTRQHAQALFKSIRNAEPEGVYHLSTTMYPAHRKSVLKEIRKRLASGSICHVVSTSLVEAGVDLDFETVYREQAGLDSIIQAAGRCNREGARKATDSIVYVFESSEFKPPRFIQSHIDAFQAAVRLHHDDIAGPEAIRAYFERLYYHIGDEHLDSKSIIPMFNTNVKSAAYRFTDAAQSFMMIDDTAQHTVYVLQSVPELEERLFSGERSRALMRALSPYNVSLFLQEISALLDIGAVEQLDVYNKTVWLLAGHYYDDHLGVLLTPESGKALYS